MTGDGTTRGAAELRRHWDAVYEGSGPTSVSWYQREPTVSLRLLEALSLSRDAAIIDVGGGASTLVDGLVAQRFSDITVLDVSEAALQAARDRLGAAVAVHWLHQDLLAWRPSRRFDVWHDRALFHFLVEPVQRERYLETLRASVRRGGHVIIGTFASDGPERCSGLTVARYGPNELVDVLGPGFELVSAHREEHVTPTGIRQPFTWVIASVGHRSPG